MSLFWFKHPKNSRKNLKLELYTIFVQLDLNEKSITPLQLDFIVRTEMCVL